MGTGKKSVSFPPECVDEKISLKFQYWRMTADSPYSKSSHVIELHNWFFQCRAEHMAGFNLMLRRQGRTLVGCFTNTMFKTRRARLIGMYLIHLFWNCALYSSIEVSLDFSASQQKLRSEISRPAIRNSRQKHRKLDHFHPIPPDKTNAPAWLPRLHMQTASKAKDPPMAAFQKRPVHVHKFLWVPSREAHDMESNILVLSHFPVALVTNTKLLQRMKCHLILKIEAK